MIKVYQDMECIIDKYENIFKKHAISSGQVKSVCTENFDADEKV